MPQLGSRATIREIIGANIEAARKNLKPSLSQAALGARLGQWLETPWSPQATSLAERGRRAFGADDLLALSIGLRVSVQQLMTPPAEVETVITASGLEVPRVLMLQDVVGASASAVQVGRARDAGRLEELETLAEMVGARRDHVLAQLSDSRTGESEATSQRRPPASGREPSLREAVQEQFGTVPSKGQLWIGTPHVDAELVEEAEQNAST